MRIKYVGPHAEGVEVLDLPDFDIIQRDKPIDVPDDVAKSLLQQETNWVEVKADPATTKVSS
jgi:hypothetical protein